MFGWINKTYWFEIVVHHCIIAIWMTINVVPNVWAICVVARRSFYENFKISKAIPMLQGFDRSAHQFQMRMSLSVAQTRICWMCVECCIVCVVGVKLPTDHLPTSGAHSKSWFGLQLMWRILKMWNCFLWRDVTDMDSAILLTSMDKRWPPFVGNLDPSLWRNWCEHCICRRDRWPHQVLYFDIRMTLLRLWK